MYIDTYLFIWYISIYLYIQIYLYLYLYSYVGNPTSNRAFFKLFFQVPFLFMLCKLVEIRTGYGTKRNYFQERFNKKVSSIQSASTTFAEHGHLYGIMILLIHNYFKKFDFFESFYLVNLERRRNKYTKSIKDQNTTSR